MMSENWNEIISSGKSKKISLRELWSYRDLVILFVRRDFVKEFKQTILGPLWFVIQPIFQTCIVLFMFGKIGGLGPQGIPQISFYLGGVLMWNLFSENLVKTSETFRANANIFGKVYYPRLVMPIAQIITSFLKLLVQLSIFFVAYFYELYSSPAIDPNIGILLVPVYFLIAAILGTGLGLIISSLTTKYWDLRFLVQFGVQLLMFVSTVTVSFSVLADKPVWMQNAIVANPVSSIIEAFRNAFLGPLGGEIYVPGLIYSCTFAVLSLIVGIIIFNRVEKNFMDTV